MVWRISAGVEKPQHFWSRHLEQRGLHECWSVPRLAFKQKKMCMCKRGLTPEHNRDPFAISRHESCDRLAGDFASSKNILGPALLRHEVSFLRSSDGGCRDYYVPAIVHSTHLPHIIRLLPCCISLCLLFFSFESLENDRHTPRATKNC